MSNYGKGIPLASGFDLGAKIPLDARTVVNTIEERDAHVTNNRVYVGMRVFVSNENKEYLWNGTDWELVPNKTYVDDAVANVKIDEEQLANYATKDEIPTKTSQLTNDSNFTTESYVTDAINNASLGGGEGSSVDLSIYQTKTDDTLTTSDKTIVGAINELDIESVKAEDYSIIDMTIENDVNTRLTNLENDKADKTEIPTKTSDLTNDSSFATESYVTDAINNASLGGEGVTVDLSLYQTKEDNNLSTTNKTIVGAINELDIEGIKAEDFENSSVIIENNLTSRVSNLELTKADISYVDTQIANAQLGGSGGSTNIDLSKYATKEYVDYQIENHTHPKVTNEDIEQIMNNIF